MVSWSWNKRTIYVAKTAKSDSEEHVLEQKVCTTSLGTSRWKLQKENLKIHTLYFLNLKSTQSEFTLSYQLDYSSVSLGNRKVFCINSCKSIVYSNATYWHSKFYKKKKWLFHLFWAMGQKLWGQISFKFWIFTGFIQKNILT